VWSVSVEIYLYMVFFIVALKMPQRWLGQVMVTALMMLFWLGVDATIGPLQMAEPIFCFFAGGFVFLIWSRFCQSRNGRIGSIVVALVGLGVASIMCWRIGPDSYVLGVVAYPSTILLLAAVQCVRHDLGRGLRLLGDITYSTYLLHFPIQLGLMLLVKSNVAVLDFTSPLVWLLFFGLVLAASIATYYGFERPMQRLSQCYLLPHTESKKNPELGRKLA
jgi:peptidoglycan/LPS O-acetylase OafA/YrhL